MKFLSFGMAALTVATLASLAPASAQQAAQWTGEGAFSAGFTTGNTETTDLGLGVKLARETQVWKTAIEAQADFGETDGLETKNRIFLAGQLDRQINDKLYGFGRASHEADEFSGFDSRIFVGAGLGYQILEGGKASWSVEGGPGLKIDEVKANPAALPPTQGETVESFSVFGASKFAYDFNENVAFSNDTNMLYAEESTQFVNVTALTAKLTSALSARISLDVRHDTNPPFRFEATDTATRISLVYAIGG